jgi:N-acetylmuramic acid 6-phosphate etherase
MDARRRGNPGRRFTDCNRRRRGLIHESSPANAGNPYAGSSRFRQCGRRLLRQATSLVMDLSPGPPVERERNSGHLQAFRKVQPQHLHTETCTPSSAIVASKWMSQYDSPDHAEQGCADMPTEHMNPRFVDLDSWSTGDMIEAMYDGQRTACAAVAPALPAIHAAVDEAVSALKRGGRLVYVGAGSSGRIAIQDGAELGPTYDWPGDRIVFVMAGGMQALVRSVEGAEDDQAKGAEAIAAAHVHQPDVVIAVAASGTTPFTVGALHYAAARGALAIAVANNRGAPLFEPARHRILIETGTEVLAGSTRMQAGTAQKIVLNLFSTAVMVKLGRVYRGLMVSMRASNAKLLRRAEIIVSQIVGCDANAAATFVQRAEGDVKMAVLLGLGWEPTEAVEALLKHEGNLRSVIEARDRT